MKHKAPSERRALAESRVTMNNEALTAASVAALTIYDMLTAFDRAMEIGPTRVVEKAGGRSEEYRR